MGIKEIYEMFRHPIKSARKVRDYEGLLEHSVDLYVKRVNLFVEKNKLLDDLSGVVKKSAELKTQIQDYHDFESLRFEKLCDLAMVGWQKSPEGPKP